MKLLIALLLVLSSIQVFATGKSLEKKSVEKSDAEFSLKVKKFAQDYQLGRAYQAKQIYFARNLKNKTSEVKHVPRDCRPGDQPDRENCFNAACSLMPSYLCDDQADITRVLEACRGSDGSCLTTACRHMPSYLCDDVSDITAIATVCRGSNGSCVDAICGKMPSYLCDDKSDLVSVLEICKDVSVSCVDAVCARLPSYQCDDLSDLKTIARQCAGRN